MPTLAAAAAPDNKVKMGQRPPATHLRISRKSTVLNFDNDVRIGLPRGKYKQEGGRP